LIFAGKPASNKVRILEAPRKEEDRAPAQVWPGQEDQGRRASGME
jgi:hypothetical protein